MKTIGGIFGRSPLGPLLEHMLRVIDCLGELKPLIERFVKSDFEGLKTYAKKISEYEHKADRIKDEIKISLTKSILSAINRSEVLALLKEQDAIADSCEDVSKLIAVRNTEVHPKLGSLIMELTAKVIETVKVLYEANKELEEGVAQGENQKLVGKIVEKINQIHKIEWETDEIQFEIDKQLFAVEKELDPVTVIFLMEVVRHLGRIADHAENTADVLRRIVT